MHDVHKISVKHEFFHKHAKFSFHLKHPSFYYQTERRFKSGQPRTATGEEEKMKHSKR